MFSVRRLSVVFCGMAFDEGLAPRCVRLTSRQGDLESFELCTGMHNVVLASVVEPYSLMRSVQILCEETRLCDLFAVRLSGLSLLVKVEDDANAM